MKQFIPIPRNFSTCQDPMSGSQFIFWVWVHLDKKIQKWKICSFPSPICGGYELIDITHNTGPYRKVAQHPYHCWVPQGQLLYTVSLNGLPDQALFFPWSFMGINGFSSSHRQINTLLALQALLKIRLLWYKIVMRVCCLGGGSNKLT